MDPEKNNNEFELSIQKLIYELNLFFKILKRNYIVIFLLTLIGGICGFSYAYFAPTIYLAKTRFMLKNEGIGGLFGGQMSGLSSLLGGGQMGTPLERTSEVISSERILGNALLKAAPLNDTVDLIINHLINKNNLRKEWENDTLINNVSFRLVDTDISKMTKAQRKVYKLVKSMLIPEKGEGLVKKTYDKKSGILTLVCENNDEQLSIILSNAIYNELSDFFVEQMTYTAENNANVMKNKLDSVQIELKKTRNEYASQSDQSLGLLLQKDKVSLKSLAVKEQMLTIMYSEALKNYEGFEFINKAAVPSLTLIDFPYTPLPKKNKSKIIFTIIGMLTFNITTILFFRFLSK